MFRKGFKLIWEQATTPDGVDIYMVHVKGKFDAVMIQAGKEFGLPRGFKILFCPSSGDISLHGFYPKFENDPDRQEKVTVPAETTKMEFFKKFSGFLGMLFTAIINGEVYWICTSKNSGTNSYSNWAWDILSSQITPSLEKEIVEGGLTLSFEVLSSKDQCHGAKVLQEAAMLTCVSSDKNVPSGQIVSYWNLNDVAQFGIDTGLQTGRLFFILGEEKIKEYCKKLFVLRDLITDKGFMELVSKCDVEINLGNTSHMDVLGNVLEGLVVHFTNENGERTTVKLKFPTYIVRTMVIRTAIQKYLKEEGKDMMTVVDCTSPAFLKIADDITSRTIPRWTGSELATKFWSSFCFKCFQELPKYIGDTENPVGTHIRVADAVLSQTIEEYGSLEEAVQKGPVFGLFPEDSSISMNDFFNNGQFLQGKHLIDNGNMVASINAKVLYDSGEEGPMIVLMQGPPGSGKSTFAKGLRKELRCRIVEADQQYDGPFKEVGIEYNPKYLIGAHGYCQAITRKDISSGKSVIVANTNTQEWEMKPYMLMKASKVVLIRCDGNYGSIHEVPTDVIDSIRMRMSSFDKITYETILNSELPKKHRKSRNSVQVRLTISNNYHITLKFYRKGETEYNDWFLFVGKFVAIQYGNVYECIQDGKVIRAVEAILSLPKDCPIPKDNLHVTLEATGFKPVESNNLLTGKIKTTILPYPYIGDLPQRGVITIE